MKNFLKHGFNAVCGLTSAAGAMFAVAGGKAIGSDLLSASPVLTSQELALAGVTMVLGLALFTAAHKRFTSKPKTGDTPGSADQIINSTLHAASAFTGGAVLGLTESPLSLLLGAVALYAGYSRLLSKKPEDKPTPVVPTVG